MLINTEIKLEALDAFDEIAEAIKQPNGITIEDGMAATGLSYHCFYQTAILLNLLGKIKLSMRDEQLRLVSSDAQLGGKDQSGIGEELCVFLADVQAGLRDGAVDIEHAEAISTVVAEQINRFVVAGLK